MKTSWIKWVAIILALICFGVATFFSVEDKVFEKASRYEDRKMEKEKSHGKESVLEKLEKKKEESKTFAGTKKTPRREDASL